MKFGVELNLNHFHTEIASRFTSNNYSDKQHIYFFLIVIIIFMK